MPKSIRLLLALLLTFCVLKMTLTAQDVLNNDVNIARTSAPFNPRTDVQMLLQKVQYQLDIVNFQEAVIELDKAVASYPDSPQILLKRAEVLTMMGRENEARQDLERARRLDPTAELLFGYDGDGSILSLLATSDSLENISARNRISGYYKFLDEEYQRQKIDNAQLLRLEDVLNEVNRNNYPGATSLANDLLRDYPDSAPGNDLYGTLLLREGRYNEAKTYFKKAIAADENFAIGYYNLGRIAAIEKDMQTADEYYQKAIDLEGNLSKAYFKRARLRQQQGMNREALADYDMLIKKYGDLYPEAYLNRSYVHRALGNFDQALADLSTVIDNRRTADPELLLSRGNLLMVFNREKEAITDYTTVINKSLNNAEAYYNRGLAFLKLNDFTSACVDLDKSAQTGFLPAKEMYDQYCGN